MKCRYCGNEISQNDKYCKHCGAFNTEYNYNNQENETETPKPEGSVLRPVEPSPTSSTSNTKETKPSDEKRGFDAYLDMWRRYVDFEGRSTIAEFWFAVLFDIIFGLAISYIYSPLMYFYSLATFIPRLALAVRRLHDTGRSGWYVLINLIPLVGIVIFIIWACEQSKVENNPYRR